MPMMPTENSQSPSIAARFAKALALARTAFSEQGLVSALRVSGRLVSSKAPRLVRRLAPWGAGGIRRGRSGRSGATGSDGEARVALMVAGGVGDLLVIGRFLRDLQQFAGPFRFDVYCPQPQLIAWAWRHLDGLSACYDDIAFERMAENIGLEYRSHASIDAGRLGSFAFPSARLRARPRATCDGRRRNRGVPAGNRLD